MRGGAKKESSMDESAIELGAIDSSLKGLSRLDNPAKWARLMNLKGIVLTNLQRYEEAAAAFTEALKLEDQAFKSKVYLNFAKIFFFTRDTRRALELLTRLFENSKAVKRFPEEILGYAHLLRGQIYNISKDEKLSLSEFRKAEYFFEVGANPMGVGLACLEIARVHIKNESLSVAWNFLRKSELFLNKLGEEEKLGVYICKAVALYYSGKGDEAIELLKGVYDTHSGSAMGKGLHTIDEIIDAYLDTRSRMLQYQKALI